MSKRALLSSLALVVGLAGCGGASPAQDAKSAQAQTVKPNRGRRSASDALKKAWPTEELDLAVYIDAEGLVKTKLVSVLVRELAPILAASLSAQQKACIDDAVLASRELALASMKEGGDFLVARLDPAAVDKVGVCLRDAGAQPATIKGAAAAWTKGDDVIAVTGSGVFLSGPQSVVDHALAGRGDGRSLEAASLGRDEYVAWTASVVDGAPPMHGSILVTDDRFLLSADGDAPDDAIAERLEGAKDLFASSLLSEKLPPEQTEAVKRLVAGVAVKRSGRHLEGRFDLHGPAEQVASDLVTGGTIAIYAVRQYILRSKQAEAQNVIGQLARVLSEEWKAAGPAAAKKKLVSYPPVPKEVPKGARYQSSPADWKAWAPLKFEMPFPQYYQYEIKAAKDGKSAEIIARGDLNGNGTASEFKLTVKVGADGKLQIAPSLQETNPDE